MPAGKFMLCEADGPLGRSDPERVIVFAGRPAAGEARQPSNILVRRKATKAATSCILEWQRPPSDRASSAYQAMGIRYRFSGLRGASREQPR